MILLYMPATELCRVVSRLMNDSVIRISLQCTKYSGVLSQKPKKPGLRAQSFRGRKYSRSITWKMLNISWKKMTN